MRSRLAAAVVTLIAIGCSSRPQTSQTGTGTQGLAWRRMGSWSGHGNSQTESVESESGQLRIRWRTSPNGPGGGQFRLTAQSSISGRPLQVAVDHRGGGEGTAFVDQEPHVFYFVVESADLDWSFTVEDSVAGTVEKTPQSRTP